MEETIRIRTARVIYYQGPRKWVENCLERVIRGTMRMGPGKFVTGSGLVHIEEPPIDGLEADVPTFAHTQAGDSERRFVVTTADTVIGLYSSREKALLIGIPAGVERFGITGTIDEFEVDGEWIA